MSQLKVEVPDSLRAALEAAALREGVALDIFLALALEEKLMAMTMLDYLRREASLGRREDFERFLASVPSAPVPDTDRLPE